MPGINISCGDQNLRLGIRFDELFSKCNGRPVAYSLAMAKQLVPLLTAEFALPVKLGSECILPH